MTWSTFEDTNNLKSVEYRFDSENWIASGKTDKAFNGLPVDITSLADGEHTVSIRTTDVVENVGAAGTMKLYKDTTAPTAESITVHPDSWTISDTVNVTWAGLRDPHRGLARAEYFVAGGDWYDVLTPYVPPEPDINEPGKGESGGGSEGDGDQKSASTSSGNDQNGFLLLTGLFEPIQQSLSLINITNPQGLLSLFADPDGDALPTLGERGNITAYLTGLPDGEHEIAFKVTD